jgi:hypothetical protein
MRIMGSYLTVLVVMLIIPSASFAGSATSRWDFSVGGFVKADFGYADQGVSADSYLAARRSGVQENVYDEYGNYFNAAGETRLNFLVKGPETWGARSSAFIEGDFRSGSTSYGLFTLRHAFLKFDWARTTLTIGHTWQPWGYLPSYVILNTGDLLTFNRGQRQPQITLARQIFGKEIIAAISLFSPYNTLSCTVGQNVVNSYTRSGLPQIASEVNWKTERFGKIGPWILQIGAGGFYGIEKVAFNRANPNQSTTTSTFNAGGNAAVASHVGSDKVEAWGVSLKGFIPIVPEKGPGVRANALALAFAAFTGQNWNGSYFASAVRVPTYDQGGFDYAAPNFYGGWGQLMYYITNKLSTNFEYGQIRYNTSRRFRTANPDAPVKLDQYIVNLIYDANAAIRLGAQYSRYYTKYGAPVNGLKDEGAFNMFRVAAIYFF